MTMLGSIKGKGEVEMKKVRLGDILKLQGAVALFSLSSMISKFIGMQEGLTGMVFLLLFAELAVLGIYAIIWQQLLKRFELSTAYINKGMVLLWYMIWSIFIFGDEVGIKNYIGVIIAIAGIVLLNIPEKGGQHHGN